MLPTEPPTTERPTLVALAWRARNLSQKTSPTLPLLAARPEERRANATRPWLSRTMAASEIEVVGQELSDLGQRLSDVEKRLAEVQKVNARLEDAAVSTARALEELSASPGAGE